MKQRNKKKHLQKHLVTAANKILKQMVVSHNRYPEYGYAWKDAYGYTPKEAALNSSCKSDTYKVKLLYATKFFEYSRDGFNADGHFYDVKVKAIIHLRGTVGMDNSEYWLKLAKIVYQWWINSGDKPRKPKVL